MIQYQGVAAPPPALQEVEEAPTFFAAYSPASLPSIPPQHTTASIAPPFQTLPAPTTGDAYYPDRLEPGKPQHPQPVLAPPFQTLPAPDKSWSAIYPDRLEPYRLREGVFTQNVEPIPQPVAPDFFRLTTFPHRIPPIPPTPGLFVQNVEPIPQPPAPEGVEATFPDRLVRAEVPQPPTFFFDPNPTLHFQQIDYSRGLHVGDVRGFYHTPDIATAAPWAAAQNTPSAQTLTSGVEAVVDLTGPASRPVFGGTNLDPWGMIDTANDRIVFSHDGYYIVNFNTASVWEGSATGAFRVRVRYFLASGALQREVMRDTRQFGSAITGPGMSLTSDIQPFVRGGWLQVLIVQNTTGDQTLGSAFFSVVRVAGPSLVLPT